MKKQFVTHEIALKLKELCFDEPCFRVYDDQGYLQLEYQMNQLKLEFVKAPLWQQVIDWFRDKYGIIIYVSSHTKYKHLYQLMGENSRELTEISEWISSYESARELAILKAIELINEKK